MGWSDVFDLFPSYVLVLLVLLICLQLLVLSRNDDLFKSLCIIIFSPFVFCFCVVQMVWRSFIRMCSIIACDFIDE